MQTQVIDSRRPGTLADLLRCVEDMIVAARCETGMGPDEVYIMNAQDLPTLLGPKITLNRQVLTDGSVVANLHIFDGRA